MHLTTIGTGTAAPHPTRSAAAHLVRAGSITLLLDCGAGAVHRMAAVGVPWQSITHVAVTHFHPDHIADLVMLVMGWRWGQLPPRAEPVTVYGPPGTGVFLEQLAALYGAWLLAPGFPLTVRELVPDAPGENRFEAYDADPEGTFPNEAPADAQSRAAMGPQDSGWSSMRSSGGLSLDADGMELSLIHI